MIADLKPYPEYKESGQLWLGQVQADWAVRRIKSAVMNVIEQTLEMTTAYGCVGLEHVDGCTEKARPEFSSKPFTEQVKRFRKGNFLFGNLLP